MRQITATLVFDSYDAPAPAGVRAIGDRPRRMIFKAGGIDIDVKIEATQMEKQISLDGQVLGNQEAFYKNAPVGLESHGVVRYTTTTNEVGEFTFDVPPDSYNLSIDLPEGQLTIFRVFSGAA